MKLKRFLPDSDKGFTIVESLVASTIGLMMLGMVVSAIMSSRSLYQNDLRRTLSNQNLRSAMDIVGAAVREAGENLNDTFPAIEIINGVNGEPDELIIRRNLIDEVLKLCQPLSESSTSPDVYFAVAGTEPGCTYSDQQQNFNSWKAYREESEFGYVKAYIYNPATQQGEFFEYSDETDTGAAMYISRSWGAWQHSYEVGQTAVYILEEWHFTLDNTHMGTTEDILQVVENDDDTQPINIVYDIKDFGVRAVMQDGSTRDSFSRGELWSEILGVEVTLAGEKKFKGRLITAVLSGRYFIRNILSN